MPVATHKPSPGQLTTGWRLALGIVALLLTVATFYYLKNPPLTTTVTAVRDATHRVVKSTTTTQRQTSDAILIAGFGFSLILGLTAAFNGRLTLTGPGGSAVEITSAIVAAVDATLDPRDRRVSAEEQETLDRWKDLRERLASERRS